MDKSLFNVVSIGYVAKDIAEDSLFVEIFPLEIFPAMTKGLTKNENVKNSNKNINNDIESLMVVKKQLIKAKWLPHGNPNRLDPPTVGKGETVLVHRYSDSDKYFWSTLYNEFKFRKKEKITTVLSNRSEITDGLNKLDKCYYVSLDTINKFIRLHTDDSDGELCTYDVEFDTKNGYMTILDGKDNEITLDSAKDKLSLITNNDIYSSTDFHTVEVETDRKDTIGNDRKVDIGNDETLKVGNDNIVDIGNDKTLKIGNDNTVDIGNDKTLNVKNSYSINLKKFSVSNGSDELIALLSELITIIVSMKHLDSLMGPTTIMPPYAAQFNNLKSRLDKFK